MQEKSEPIYDDDMLDLIGKCETAELINALVKYAKRLETMVVALRVQVNNLTPEAQLKPCLDLHSDIYEVFYDYPAYQKFKEIVNALE